MLNLRGGNFYIHILASTIEEPNEDQSMYFINSKTVENTWHIFLPQKKIQGPICKEESVYKNKLCMP